MVGRLSIWPHQLSTGKAIALAASICAIECSVLLMAAFIDNSLVLPNDGVGLLHHPGIFAILIGDIVLFTLSAKCTNLMGKVGIRLPNTRPEMIRRYFRIFFWNDIFSGKRYFIRIYAFLAFLGVLALINQTVILFDATRYYGHDTFDSTAHIWSFLANRVNLAISWCFVVPAFITYTLIYIHTVRTFICRVRKRKFGDFYVAHPDHAGGYAFFGVLNTWFVLGAVTILVEALLLFFTHRKLETTYVLATFLGGGIILFASIFPMLEVRRMLKLQKRRLKISDFSRTGRSIVTPYHLALNYKVHFSAYNTVTAFAITALRALSFLPALVPRFHQLMQMIGGS